MRINSLILENFRNHQKLNLNFVGPKTTIIGRNGRGKTNIVEAVNYFATLGSHRVATDQPLIKNQETSAEITGVFEKHGRTAKAKITINSNGQNKVYLNDSPLAKPRDLLGLVNTVIFSPEDLDLVKGDPSVRRKYLDDFSVLLSPKFAGVRSDYERVLKQRNTLLKSAGRRTLNTSGQETLTAWNEQLIKFGSEIANQRLLALKKLTPFITQHGATLSGESEPLEVNYFAKWFTDEEKINEQFADA